MRSGIDGESDAAAKRKANDELFYHPRRLQVAGSKRGNIFASKPHWPTGQGSLGLQNTDFFPTMSDVKRSKAPVSYVMTSTLQMHAIGHKCMHFSALEVQLSRRQCAGPATCARTVSSPAGHTCARMGPNWRAHLWGEGDRCIAKSPGATA